MRMVLRGSLPGHIQPILLCPQSRMCSSTRKTIKKSSHHIMSHFNAEMHRFNFGYMALPQIYPKGELTVLPDPLAGFKGPTSKGREKKKRRLCSSNFFKYALAMADPMLFLKRGKTIYQPRPHLSQMHTAIYELFTWKKAAFWEKNEPIGGKPPRFESATVHWEFTPLPQPNSMAVVGGGK